MNIDEMEAAFGAAAPKQGALNADEMESMYTQMAPKAPPPLGVDEMEQKFNLQMETDGARPGSAQPPTGEALAQSKPIIPENLDLTFGGALAKTKEGLTQAYLQSRLEGIRSQIKLTEPYGDKYAEGRMRLQEQEADILQELQETKDLVSTYQKFDQSYLPKDESIPAKAIRSTVASSPSVFMGLAGYLLGGPAGAITLGGGTGAAQTMADSYLKAAPNMTHGEAMTYATLDTMAEFAGDKLLFGVATKEGGSFLRRAITTMLVGAGEEMGTTALQDFHEFVRLNPQMTVKEALENLAVAGLSGATMGIAARGGAAGIQKVQEMEGERQEKKALEEMLTEVLSARGVRMESVEGTILKLYQSPRQTLLAPGQDWNQLTPPEGVVQPDTGTGYTGIWNGLEGGVNLPQDGGAAQMPIDWSKRERDGYAAQTIVTVKDLKPVIEELLVTDPQTAARFVHDHQEELFGKETVDPDSPVYGATPRTMVEEMMQRGVVDQGQRDTFLTAYEKLLEEDYKAELAQPVDLAKELRDKADELSKRVRDPLNIPLTGFEAEEANFYATPGFVQKIRSAKTANDLIPILQQLIDPKFRGSVSYYMAQRSIDLAKASTIGGGTLSAATKVSMAEAFARREQDVQHLKATGWVPQTLSSRARVGNTTIMGNMAAMQLSSYASQYGIPAGDAAAAETPGTVTIRPSMPNADLLKILAKKWLKRFGLSNTSVIILPEKNGSYHGSHMSFSTAQGDVMVIWLDPNLKKSVYFEVFAHEMGHGIVPRLLEQSPADVQDALKKLYNERLRSVMSLSVREAQRALGGPARDEAHWGVDMADRVAAEILQSDGAELSYGDSTRQYYSGYFFSFEEFLAHEMERAFARDFVGVDNKTKGFILKALGALKSIFSDFQKAVNETDVTFGKFLEYHARQAEIEGVLERTRAIYDHISKLVDTSYTTTAPTFRIVTKIANPVAGPGVDVGKTSSQESPGFSTEIEKVGSVESFIKKKLGVDADISGLDGDLDRFTWIKKLFGNLITIARDNRHIKELSDPTGPVDPTTGERKWGYMELAQFFAQERMKWISAADGRVKEWSSLPLGQQDLLGRLLYEETLRGTHMTVQELANAGLGTEGQRIFSEIKADFSNFVNAMEQAAVARAQRKHGNSLALPTILQDIAARFAQLKQKPYFPLTRFGKFLVIVRAPATAQQGAGRTQYLEAFESKIEAMLQVKALKAQYPGMDVKVDKVNETDRAFMGVPPALWESIRDDLNLDPVQLNRLNELIYKMAPDQSFTKHFIARKKIAGFSRDAMRSYAAYFMHGSGHMAKMAWAEQLQDAVSRLRQSANEVTGDSVKRRMIADYAGTHLAETLNPTADWAKLRGAVAVLYLGGMLRTALVNLTQVPAFTYPHLAAKYGDAAAVAELTKGYAALRKIATATRTLKGWENDALNKYAQNQQLSPAEQKFVDRFYGLSTELRSAIERGVREGFLDESFAMVLAGMANGNMLSRLQSTSKLGYYTRALSHTLMIPFEAAEKINRRVTFTAGFNLAYKEALGRGLSPAAAAEQAFQAGKEAVQTTQFEYAKWNRPEALRGRKGAFLMFMQYQFNALSFLMGGDKGWWRAWAMLLMMGGLMGLPFAEDMMSLVSWLLSSENKKVNAKHEMKKFLEEVVGDGEGLLDHGISRYGFGLSFLGDMSGSVSMGRIIPGMELLNGTGGFNDGLVRGLNDFGGATTALALQMARGLTDSSLPAWKRVELLQPSSLGDRILQSYRWLHEGAEKSPNGSLITSFDTENPAHLAELAFNLGGFTPRAVSVEEEDRGPGREQYYLRQEMVRFYSARKSELIKVYSQAVKDKEHAEAREAMQEIHKFNKEVPAPALRINAGSLRQGIKSRVKADAMDRGGEGRTRQEQAVERMLKE